MCANGKEEMRLSLELEYGFGGVPGLWMGIRVKLEKSVGGRFKRPPQVWLGSGRARAAR